MHMSPVIVHISRCPNAYHLTISVLFLTWLFGKQEEIQSTLHTDMEGYYYFSLIHTRKGVLSSYTDPDWFCCITKSKAELVGKDIIGK